MTHPPRGGFYSSDVQLCGQNFCIRPSQQPLAAYVAGLKGRTALNARAWTPSQTVPTAGEEVLCHDSESFYPARVAKLADARDLKYSRGVL
jgi:hypothetical protein